MAGSTVPDPELASGERLLWSAAADWRRAARPPRRGLSFLTHLTIAAAATLAAALVIGADPTTPHSFGRSLYAAMLIAVIASVAVLWGKALNRGFALFQKPDPRAPARYWLTDRRLIVSVGELPHVTTRSVTKHSRLMEALVTPNGSVKDLKLWFAARDDDDYFDYADPLVLYALADADKLKADVLTHFNGRASS
ncbi:MAG: hypothetical protein AAFX44_10440 [Pseudomonadota bacterium]